MARNVKEYYLMHKDIRVCLMEISDDVIDYKRRGRSTVFSPVQQPKAPSL